MAQPTPIYKIEKTDLRKLTVDFVDKMDGIPSFMDHAMTLNLLRKAHNNAIMSTQNVQNQTRKMLDFVEKTLPLKSNDFLEALIKSGNETLAQKLVPETSISDLLKSFNVVVPSPVTTTTEFQIDNFTRSRVNIINYMSDMPTFIDYALQINLLNKQHKNEILSTGNVDNQKRKMCDIMEKKLPEKTDEFLYCLNGSGNVYLVDLLSEPGNTCDFSRFRSLEPVVTKRPGTDTYPMKRRGRVLIIENIIFDNPYYNRPGSEKDRKELESFFSELGFDVIIKQNLTAKDMENVLHEAIHDEKGNLEDCFILFILSHGYESEICGRDFSLMNYSVIFNEFNSCPIWNDKSNPKPKLIYIQACQESKSMKQTNEEPDARVVSSHISPGGHFYIMYAAIPGEYAYRMPNTGSRLIRSLLEVYKEKHKTEDIETMGIEIKTMVYTSLDSERQQIAMCHSCLPKRLYLGHA